LDRDNTKQDDKTERDWLWRIYNAKIEEEKQIALAGKLDHKIYMEPLDFRGVVMIWQLNDIVEHLVELIIAQLMKRRNRKMRKDVKIVGIEANVEIGSVPTPVTADMEMDDKKLVMNELGKTCRFQLKARLFWKIKELKKWIKNPGCFDGYTKETDSGQLRMLA
jgi:hypothetical protein